MPNNKAIQQTRMLVQAAAAACEDKKGEDTRILALDPMDSGLADFFLVTSASNNRQTVAIADEIEHRLKKDFGTFPNSVEGRKHGEWILLDYVDFVAHVFLAERRAFYDIERLRKSARPFTVPEFSEELKAALAAKTRAVRSKAASKAEESVPPARKKAISSKKAVPAARKAAPAKRASVRKPKSVVAKPAVKRPAKKAPLKKAAAKKKSARR